MNLGGMLNFISINFGEVGFFLEEFLGGMIFGLWRAGAWIIGILESMFFIFAGVIDLPAQTEGGSETNVINSIIQHPNIQRIFTNLMAVAVILMIFFTIIVLIRNHYKEQDGGNPYKIVFRMFNKPNPKFSSGFLIALLNLVWYN